MHAPPIIPTATPTKKTLFIQCFRLFGLGCKVILQFALAMLLLGIALALLSSLVFR